MSRCSHEDLGQRSHEIREQHIGLSVTPSRSGGKTSSLSALVEIRVRDEDETGQCGPFGSAPRGSCPLHSERSRKLLSLQDVSDRLSLSTLRAQTQTSTRRDQDQRTHDPVGSGQVLLLLQLSKTRPSVASRRPKTYGGFGSWHSQVPNLL